MQRPANVRIFIAPSGEASVVVGLPVEPRTAAVLSWWHPEFANEIEGGKEELPTTYKSSLVRFDEARAKVALLGRKRDADN
jgi:hypothetical protein